jgi:hypothetical protein
MANFAHYFNSRFAGCRLLAKAWDQHRERDVSIYQIPGQVDCVGVSDTIDRWIAPVAPELFNVNIHQLFRDLQSGVEIKLPIIAPRLGATVKTSRRALIAGPPLGITPDLFECVRRRPGKSDAPATNRRALI